MNGYNVQLNVGCTARYIHYKWYKTLADCVEYCDADAQCDYFTYCDKGWCAGDCSTYTGPCKEDDNDEYLYERRGS